MTEMIRERHLRVVPPQGDTFARLRVGVAFVPCAICLKPLDLAAFSDRDRPQLCDDHRVGDYLPLN